MKVFSKLAILSLILCFVGCSGIENDREEVLTLIITGNNYESRALAEHLHENNHQPFMLIPNNPSDKQIYVNGPSKQVMTIDKDRFYSFINFVGPKQIIILGNQKYVPSSYIQQINPNITKYVFDDSDWILIAWQVEELTGYSGLAESYTKTYNELVRSGTIKGPQRTLSPKEPSVNYPKN